MSFDIFIRLVLDGIANGMILFIISSGLTLVFGVMNVINFAHGSLYMLAAYIGVVLAGVFASELVGFVVALVVVPAFVALLAFLPEYFLFRRIYEKEHLLQLLLTYGLTLVLSDIVRIVWGTDLYRWSKPDVLSGRFTLSRFFEDQFGINFTLFDVRVARFDIFVFIVGLAIAIGLWYLLQRTRFGRIIRAAVNNPEMLSALGVNVKLIFTGVFMLGAALAGLGGVLDAVRNRSVVLGMDAKMIILAFAIVVIGGLGSIPGALIGSMIVAIILAFGIVLPDLTPEPFSTVLSAIPDQALPFLVMAVILIVRPWGLLGKSETKRL